MAAGLFAKTSRVIKDRLALRLQAQKSADQISSLFYAAERACLPLQSAGHATGRAGQGPEFWQFRPYAAQDRPQDIDWRRSAKGDEAIVRLHEKSAAHRFTLWCARGQSMQFRSSPGLYSKQDYARILTLALALRAARAGDQAALLNTGIAGRSSATLEQIAQTLLEPALPLHDDLPGSTRFAPLQGSSLFMIGDFLCPPAETMTVVKNAAGAYGSLTLVQVLDPAELSLPYRGRIVFADMLGAPQLEAGADKTLRDAYNGRIREHTEELAALCRANAWRHVLCPTNQEPAQALLSLITQEPARDWRAT